MGKKKSCFFHDLRQERVRSELHYEIGGAKSHSGRWVLERQGRKLARKKKFQRRETVAGGKGKLVGVKALEEGWRAFTGKHDVKRKI